ncbi:BolA protein [Natronocella acetinitrilica]|uniref:BolA protein n=1 Tax=Natronocella acetinitrilica TaxID=414046 RepID=A0AAE3KBG7_9GAMM|nr:BolA family protein [Natronocella acetinitrilica]MCP1674779.1 BolA protein [Natronocella acetinitrilica]
MTVERIRMIEARIRSALPVEHLDIEDESHLHAGHPGAKDGRGHFRVTVISESFGDCSPLQRHRLVYDAVGGLMQTDIHALSIQAMTPAEYKS